MNDILNKSMVLVLNRNWQAVNVRTPQEAFCMMATNVATALEIEGEHHIRPVSWDEWLMLPIRPQDNAVQTVRGPIRVPTVIVAVNYAKEPKKCGNETTGGRASKLALPIQTTYSRNSMDSEYYAVRVHMSRRSASSILNWSRWRPAANVQKIDRDAAPH